MGPWAPPGFPLTGAMAAPPLVPPPSPYGPPGAMPPQRGPFGATLRGPTAQYTVQSGAEVRVGRDPALCPFYLAEPRVSGVHATLRFDAGQLFVRDETSNNGTWIYGARIPSGVWTGVPAGAQVRFGPVEFLMQLEA